MSNMSYCRFENTLRDLRDCISAVREALEDDTTQRKFLEELSSEHERDAFKALAAECQEFLDAHDEMAETETEAS